jgi:uncharacterized protein YggL (DUF469 family)
VTGGGNRQPGQATRDAKRKMRTRLRKKKHFGEFTQWGRQLVITRNHKDGFDDFLDAFIEEAVEANDCYCGGGGKEDKLDVIIELGCRSNDPAARMKRITAWLEARPDVESWKVGDELDLWHGDFKEIEEEDGEPRAMDSEERGPLR